MENLLVFAVQTGSPLVSRNQDHAKSASAIGNSNYIIRRIAVSQIKNIDPYLVRC